MPRAVILDPWVGLHTPEWLWLSTGIRAVDHCVEGICSREAHPYGGVRHDLEVWSILAPKWREARGRAAHNDH